MKKRRIYAGLAVLLAMCLTGCGGKNDVPDDGDKEVQANESGTPTPAQTVTEEAKATEEPKATPTPKPTEAAEEDTKPMIPNWFLVEQEEKFADYSVGTFVAGYNVLDYGADPTGQEDCTKIFQNLLISLGGKGGGTLYVPDGMYRLEGYIRIPKGVTLRGDWKKPEDNQAIEGTVLMAYHGKGMNNRSQPFINLELGSGIMDVVIWYPEQDPMDIQPYSPAITMGVNGYFGNEYNNVKNVTLVNAYTGVLFSYDNGGASPVINGVYGTPLEVGVEIDNIADVGRIEHVYLSPSYWVSSGLYERLGIDNPFAKDGAEEALRSYLYQNASGIKMRRNDWSYTCYVEVEGYQYGFRAMRTVAFGSDSTPNGHNYGMTFTNCQTGVSIEAGNDVGIMFAYVKMENCENGVSIVPGVSGAVQFQETDISATNRAVYMDLQCNAKMLMSECRIESGAVKIDGGVLDIVDCDFNNAAEGTPHASIGLSGRVNMVGNRYNGEKQIENRSLYASNISDEDAQMEQLPEYVEVVPEIKVPASMALFLVTDYGAEAGGQTDCTEAVRKALQAAEANGGGIVFFPPGHYRFDDTLTIPTGVELRGACDNSTVPHGEGTILEVYCGEGDVNAAPFLQLKEGSGVRGLTINYPKQIYTGTKKEEPDYAPTPYPYTIQGQGKDIYIINVGLRASYYGLDLFTYQCDNHYVDYITGQMFRVGVRIGGNSKDGTLRNMQCNTIVYACGQETKFGSFPNSPLDGLPKDPIYDYAFYNLDNLILGDCENEFLYNNFNYGAHYGIYFVNDGNGGAKNGLGIGLGLDKDCRGYYFGDGLSGVSCRFVNTQIVSTEAKEETEYIYCGKDSDFHVILFAGDFWGNPNHFVKMEENSGTFILQNGRALHPGRSTFALLEGGNFVLKAASSESMSGTAVILNDAKFEVWASVLSNAGTNTEDYIWVENLAGGATISYDNGEIGFLDRTGWAAQASNNTGNARNALDGNPNSRWDTGTAQVPGQWFVVDLGAETEFNCILLDFSGSPGDAPADYEVLVSNDGKTWSDPIASGQRGSGIIMFDSQSARFIKITQNGSGGGYWSIHEFYLLNVE